jgi:fatty-acid desaturase
MQTNTKIRLNKSNLFWITLAHLLSVVALFYFSWENLAVALIGLFLVAPIGINIGYHRLLSHRAFKSPSWLEHAMVTVGAMTGGGPPLQWAASHRRHHRYSDREMDPHDSTKGFWYSHILHLFQETEIDEGDQWKSFVPDLLTDSYLVFLNKYWLWTSIATIGLLYVAGGLPYVLWGGFVRLVMSWHVMWFVNSATHKWGYRNYNTSDRSSNCWWVALLAAGEGWHNNHHAQPACARHGHKWWELDFSYAIIRSLEFLGLAHDVRRPRPNAVEES